MAAHWLLGIVRLCHDPYSSRSVTTARVCGRCRPPQRIKARWQRPARSPLHTCCCRLVVLLCAGCRERPPKFFGLCAVCQGLVGRVVGAVAAGHSHPSPSPQECTRLGARCERAFLQQDQIYFFVPHALRTCQARATQPGRPPDGRPHEGGVRYSLAEASAWRAATAASSWVRVDAGREEAWRTPGAGAAAAARLCADSHVGWWPLATRLEDPSR